MLLTLNYTVSLRTHFLGAGWTWTAKPMSAHTEHLGALPMCPPNTPRSCQQEKRAHLSLQRNPSELCGHKKKKKKQPNFSPQNSLRLDQPTSRQGKVKVSHALTHTSWLLSIILCCSGTMHTSHTCYHHARGAAALLLSGAECASLCEPRCDALIRT